MFRSSVFAIVFLSALSLSAIAHADAPAWQDPAIDQSIQTACAQRESLTPPPADLPSATQKTKLKNCVSFNLYYGVNGPRDYTAARKCAFYELQTDTATVPGGGAILAMIYANGNGVRKNLDLAIKYACDSGGAIPEINLRIPDMLDLAKNPEPYDFCDDVSSTAMVNTCTTRGNTPDPKNTASLASIQKEALQRLQSAAARYFSAYDGANMKKETSVPRAQYEALKKRIDAKKLPSYSEADFNQADARLNAAYKDVRLIAAYTDLKADKGAIESLRRTQRAWLTYRDAWITYTAAVLSPDFDLSIETLVTNDRTAILQAALAAGKAP